MVSKDVAFINERSNVAVCTLWTKKEVVVGKLDELGVLGKVHAVGTLYTVYGINYLLHTLAQRPQIDTLVVYGADLSGSGGALVELFSKTRVPPELLWPLGELEPLLKGVKVVDLRSFFARGDWHALAEVIEASYDPSPPKRGALSLELREPRADSWPVPVSGQAIQETSLFRAWVKAVYSVMMFGAVKESEYGERQKQLLNLVVALNMHGSEYRLERELLSRFRGEDFEAHFRSLLNPEKPVGVSYTYGERLRAHPLAGDQLAWVKERLREAPNTRRAIAVLWDHGRDLRSSDPPCIFAVQGDVTGAFYNHTAFIRSNDVYAAWPLNAYGQVKLAEHIAAELGVKVGVVTLISSSAHVYEHDWQRAWELVHEHYEALKEFVPDPRGNVLIEIEGGDPRVELRAPDGRPAARFAVAYRDLKPLASFLAPDHAFYMGWEVRRALERARRGEPYVQDSEW
jgi:thymidylate synthase